MAPAIQSLDPERLPKVPLVLNGLSSRFIRENQVIPLELKNNLLKVALASQEDPEIIDALKVATGAEVQIFLGEDKVVNDYILKFYGQEPQNINRLIEDLGEGGFEFIREDEEDIGHLKDLASEAPIIKLVNMFITRAVESRASDIHIEPFDDELRVRYRIDGVLHDVEAVPKKLQAAIISRIKIMAKLNIAERRLPQDGRIKLRVTEKEIDLRVSTIPVLHGEDVVMRILLKEGIVIDLDQLGFPGPALEAFNQLIKKPNGIIWLPVPPGAEKPPPSTGPWIKSIPPRKRLSPWRTRLNTSSKGSTRSR